MIAAVVPTVGASPLLAEALGALGEERVDGEPVRVILVRQDPPPRGDDSDPRPGPARDPRIAGLCHRILDVGRNLGFAGATNLGIATARELGARWIATVNDDLRVTPGWAAALVEALEAEPGASAVQGVNLRLADPSQTDGCGLVWNRWWQAVQLHHGRPPPPPEAPVEEIFGVSATAAVFRTAVFRTAAETVFDERLGSYYEDVDLACRLRAAGGRALLVPRARALHAGSATGRQRAVVRWRSIYGNRLLVLARLLGGRFPRELPRILGRDLRDLATALVTVDPRRVAGILAGWGRAVRHLPAYAHRGGPLVALDVLERFRISSAHR